MAQSLRNRSLLIVSLAVVLFIGVSYVIARLIFIRDLDQLEQQKALRDTRRVLQAFDNSLAALVTLTTDYSRWDDTYEYVSNPNSDYVDANYIPETLSNLKLNAVVIIDSSGKTVLSIGFNSSKAQIIALPASLQTELEQNPSYLKHEKPESVSKGIILLPEGPLLIVSCPILKSDRTGPLNGALIMGRYLNGNEIQELAGIADLSLTWFRIYDSGLLEEFPAVNSVLTPHNSVYVQVRGVELISGYILLNDIQDRPALVLQANIPRTIYEQGTTNLNYLLPLMIVAGVILGVVFYQLIQTGLLSPLSRLNHILTMIRARNDLSLRIPVTSKDMMGMLITSINDMLARQEQQEREINTSKDAQRRAGQISNTIQIMQTIHALSEPDAIFQNFVELMGEHFGFYYTGVFLLDQTRLFAVLQTGTHNIVPAGYRLTIGGSSTIGAAISSGQPQKALLGKRHDQISFTHLPLASVEVALPLRIGKQIIGAIAIQSTQSEAFNHPQDMELLQEIADNLAIAYQNAQQLQQLQIALDESEQTHRRYLAEQWTTELSLQEKLHYEYENPAAAPLQPESVKLELPLILQGQGIGQITLESDRSSWSSEEQVFIGSILEQAGLALENARLFEQSRRRAAQERLVADITRRVRASTSVDTILSTAILELGRSLKASSAQVQIQPNAAQILVQSPEYPQAEPENSARSTRDEYIAPQ